MLENSFRAYLQGIETYYFSIGRPLGVEFRAYLQGIETEHLLDAIRYVIVGFEPTYKELKPLLRTKSKSSCLGFEPTYKELKQHLYPPPHLLFPKVSSLPTRN